jgi:hypothetical protein
MWALLKEFAKYDNMLSLRWPYSPPDLKAIVFWISSLVDNASAKDKIMFRLLKIFFK